MRAVVNLKHEPRLREAFEHAQAVGNTVLIDRRTRWGNRFRTGPGQDREQVIALYRADLWRRIQAGEIALEKTGRAGRVLAGLLVRAAALSWRCAGPGCGVGLASAGGARRPAVAKRRVMSAIAFRRIAPDESRIYRDGDRVGDVFRQQDVLSPGSHFYVVHLDEDPRGPCRVHDRNRIREVAEQLVLSHPLWG